MTTANDAMPEAMTVQQFAARMRQRFPGAYDDLPDEVLTERTIEHYPQYRSWIRQPEPGSVPINQAHRSSVSDDTNEKTAGLMGATGFENYQGSDIERALEPKSGEGAIMRGLKGAGRGAYGMATFPVTAAAGVAEAIAAPSGKGAVGRGREAVEAVHPAETLYQRGISQTATPPAEERPDVYPVTGFENAQPPPLTGVADVAGAAVPMVGPIVAQLAKRASEGDVAGAVSEAAIVLGGPKLLHRIMRAKSIEEGARAVHETMAQPEAVRPAAARAPVISPSPVAPVAPPRSGEVPGLRETAPRSGATVGLEPEPAPPVAPTSEALPPVGQVGRMRTEDISINPEKFQFKYGTGPEGASNLLRDTHTFNENLAGTVSVWTDPADGKTYIVNGHHRYELARRTGHESINVFAIDAPDAQSARAIGALQNIAEGRGTVLDAAKFFRDSNMTPEQLAEQGVSMGEATARDGLALSRLDSQLFNSVVQGEIPQGRAIAIAQATADPAQQRGILSLIDKAEKRGRKVSDDTVAELARFASGAGERAETTQTLFGAEQRVQNLALEKAEVSAYVKQQLAKERRVFGAVSTEAKAQTLGRIGNLIKAQENARVASEAGQAEAAYNLLSARTGPVNDILNTEAWRLANGQNAAAVKQDAYQRIRQEISKTIAGAAEDRAARVQEIGAVPQTQEPAAVTRNLFGQPQQFAPGPGAKTAGASEVLISPMQQLTEWIPRGISEHAPPVERMKTAIAAIQHRLGSVSTGVTAARLRVEGALAGLWSAYKSPPKWTDFTDAVGHWQGGLQFTSWELAKFAHAIKKAIPDPLRREALTNWVQAGGDEGLLRAWAAKAAPKYKRGYEVALELNENEKTFARNVRGYLDAQLEEAQRAGMLEHGLENYLSNIWERNAAYKQMQAILGASELQPKPFFTRQRILRDYFEGENVGLTPRNKDIGFVLATYHAAFGRAVADRGFIKQLLSAKASDNRPLVAVSGVGRTLAEDEAGAAVRAHLVLPREKGENVHDYLTVDSPVLRRWKWVGKDSEGKPIYVEGDLVVHPEAYQHLKNVLGRSALRESTTGKAILRVSSEFKSTLLSLSGFHQVQVAVHALEHRVNPLTAPKLDLNDPLQRSLVDHGLQVASFSAKEQFSEGLAASGLINKIPAFGKFTQRYTEYLFHDYIPRLKMSMAQHALERNVQRYGHKLSRDQILKLTADQANAAFGELNMKMLTRNKTFNDTMRLIMLAPDFTEARARFVAQALKPYGAEQRTALILGAVTAYTAARIVNQVLNGDPLWQPSMAFSIKVGRRAFGLRMIQGDVLHLVSNPRSFVFNRVNPLIARPLIEAIIGRDERGRRRDVTEQLKDILFAGVPIPFQALERPEDYDVAESMLKATGVSGYRYRSPAEAKAREFVNAGPTFESTRTPAEQTLMRKHRNTIEAGTFNPQAVRQDVKQGRLTERDEKTLQNEAKNPRLVRDVSRLSLEKALDVWDKASDQERKVLRPVLQRKEKQLENRLPAERKALEARLRQAVGRRSEPSEPPPLPTFRR